MSSKIPLGYRHTMHTVSNKPINFAESVIGDIDIEDIAHSLAYQCRFNGHVDRWYSVADHCLTMADVILDRHPCPWDNDHETVRYAMEALLHDAHEAYTGDIVSPLKSMFPDLLAMENRVSAYVMHKLGMDYLVVEEEDGNQYYVQSPVIRDLDKRMARHESFLLRRAVGGTYDGTIGPLYDTSPDMASVLYVNKYRQLTDLLSKYD